MKGKASKGPGPSSSQPADKWNGDNVIRAMILPLSSETENMLTFRDFIGREEELREDEMVGMFSAPRMSRHFCSIFDLNRASRCSHLWRETEWREGREERGKGQFGVNFIVCHKRFVVVPDSGFLLHEIMSPSSSSSEKGDPAL